MDRASGNVEHCCDAFRFLKSGRVLNDKLFQFFADVRLVRERLNIVVTARLNHIV